MSGSSRGRLAEALRREFSRTEPPALDALSTGIARAIEARGITTIPGANRPAKPRRALDVLLEDKRLTEEAQARRQAERDAPPPPATTVELIKRALRVEIEKLDAAEADGSDPAPTPALNSAALLRALGGENGTINGVGS